MGKKKKKYSVKAKGRMFVVFMFFGAIIATLGFTFLRDLNKIRLLYNDKRDLSVQKSDLLEEEEAIQVDINRLSDPAYIARYAREKYFYSKEGELILRLKEKKE